MTFVMEYQSNLKCPVIFFDDLKCNRIIDISRMQSFFIGLFSVTQFVITENHFNNSSVNVHVNHNATTVSKTLYAFNVLKKIP